MLWKRFVSAIIFAALVILVIKDGLWLFFATVSAIVIISSMEFSRFAGSDQGLLPRVIYAVIAWLVCFSTFRPKWLDSNLILFLAIVFPFIYWLAKRETHSAILRISSALLGIFYVGWLFGRHLILLRQMSDGRSLLFFLMGITWSGDIGAYLIGRKFGKHNITPTISPSKSAEGFLAGIISGILTALGLRYWLSIDVALPHILILGGGLTVIGQLGDLSESLLKRSANIKDSGNLIPGHGGMLDRCDSMIFIAPALYYYSVYILHFS